MYNKNEDRRTIKRKIGDRGEDIACRYLENRGFRIITRNYLKPYGEIDIVALKGCEYHFIEVKTVSREIGKGSVIHETGYRPEDNIHRWKIERLSRVIQAYLLERNLYDELWIFDVISIYLDLKSGRAAVHFIENVII